MSQLSERTRSAQAPEALAPALALSGAGPVLTVSVDADPALGAGPAASWQAPVRLGLRRLARDAYRTRSRAERLSLESRLAELAPEIEALLDPRRPGRGRTLFAAVAGGAPRRIEVQAPLPTFVALRPQAVVVPLLRVLQDGARAGVTVVTRDSLEWAEWELGALSPQTTVELDRGDGHRRHRGNPAVPQPYPERDRFEAAAGARALAQLREQGARVAEEADLRGWDVVVTGGDPRLVDALADGFADANGRAELVPSLRSLSRLSTAGAAQVVAEAVEGYRAERTAELVRLLDDSAAATRDPFVLERALAEGRVQHLLLGVPRERRPGYRAEALARRGFATGAKVTVVDAEAAGLSAGGGAALLRW